MHSSNKDEAMGVIKVLAKAIDESVSEEHRPLFEKHVREAVDFETKYGTKDELTALRAVMYADVRAAMEAKGAEAPEKDDVQPKPAPRRRKAVRVKKDGDKPAEWKPGMDPSVLMPGIKPSPQLIQQSMRVLQEHGEYIGTRPEDDYVKNTVHHKPEVVKKAEMVMRKAMEYDMPLGVNTLTSIGSTIHDRYQMNIAGFHERHATIYEKGYVRYIMKNMKLGDFMVIDNGVLQPGLFRTEGEAVKFKHVPLQLERVAEEPQPKKLVKTKPLPYSSGGHITMNGYITDDAPLFSPSLYFQRDDAVRVTVDSTGIYYEGETSIFDA